MADQLQRLYRVLQQADTIVIGAGAGLSTSAGFVYNGERFGRYFADFEQQYGFHDMYSGGFYPYDTLEEYWAYWSRYIFVNRYMDAPRPVYERLLGMVQGKDYFVITTNVDHCFQKAGFEKKRLFYTQGDYGLFQCSTPCHNGTYDNEKAVKAMMEAQGFGFTKNGSLINPMDEMAAGIDVRAAVFRSTGGAVRSARSVAAPETMAMSAGVPTAFPATVLQMRIPAGLVPRCPVCGKPMTMNLRSDDGFVEDEGWHLAAERYENFLRTRRGGRTVYLELGVGYNTPVIIKYPFWRMTAQDPDAVYVCLNKGNAGCPPEIRKRSICIDADIGEILEALQEMKSSN